jgi:hypothetical protein
MNFEQTYSNKYGYAMKRLIYILPAFLMLAVSCASSSKLNTAQAKSTTNNYVSKAIDERAFVIKVNKLYDRKGQSYDMNPSNNFIVINQNIARVNLGYMGRSWDIRQIAGINFNGVVTEMSKKQTRRGGYMLTMKVKGNNDLFTFNISVSKDGYCNIGVNHPRIDYVRYRGKISDSSHSVARASR